MKVRLFTRMAGPHGSHEPGAIVDLPADQAKELIRTNQATPLESERPLAQQVQKRAHEKVHA